MRDINGEEFQVGDTLKVIKFSDCGAGLQVGDIVKCTRNDGSGACKFQRVGSIYFFYYPNDHLQKL